MVKSDDYTSRGDDEDVEIMLAGSKKSKLKKKYIVRVLIENSQELNETGVYNSETDTNTNPKTGENKPDELTGFLSQLADTVKNLVANINEVKETVKENSQISYDSLDICMAELNSYIKSIEDEQVNSSSATPTN